MKTLVFDTETTGKADFKNPDKVDNQPRLVQLAAVLVQTTEKVAEIKSEINILVDPGVPIPPDASKVHKIFDADVKAFGMSTKVAVSIFNNLLKRADRIVGHNIDFDILVMLSEYRREILDPVLLRRGKIPRVCTMKTSTDILKLPGRYGYKFPTLGETYSYFKGAPLSGAHNALVDVRATVDILVALEKTKAKLTGGDF
jgi:DNA polymerase III epsilon subunit-like protein